MKKCISEHQTKSGNSKSVIRAFALVIGLGLFTACGHTPAIQEFANTASPTDEIAKLESDLSLAKSQQTDVLSPVNFRSAEESLNDSKKSLEKQKESKRILHEVALGRAYLNQANEVSEVAKKNIGDVVQSRQRAMAAGAQHFQDKEFRAADQNLIDVTKQIEKNKLDEAIEKRSSMQLAYLDIELRSIKQERLGQSRELITQAKNEGAEKFAPRSLALAEKSFQDTDAFITGNRQDVGQVAARSTETLRVSNHLLKITRDSKSGKNTSSEETALRMEEKSGQVASKQAQVVAGQAANRKLSAENSSLEEQKSLNQRFELASAEFSPSEAEVYKQGNALIIRLRGLEFPVAQAVVKGSNFPLLAKVQRVIKSFGKSAVIVEGHTDSNGGKALNEKLSAERAEAVRDYLTSNSDGADTDIKAIGYGYQKPLATNKTAVGRAQNRRVDVLIQPEDSSAVY